MKKISILIPCYNEEENIEDMITSIEAIFKNQLTKYDYEIIFIDNASEDKTREIIEKSCAQSKKVKAIFNVRNFGQFNSPYYGILQTDGDCTINLACDFQDPVELITKFIEEWENGYKIVIGIKKKSKENKIMFLLRSCYYKIVKKISNVKQIEHFTGFGLYDKEFLDVLRKIDDPTPFMRGLVAEYGYKIKEIPYVQPLRKAGKTKNNLYTLYDAAMLSFTSYTKIGLRLATFGGLIVSIFSFIIGLIYLILKLMYWDRFSAGSVPILIGTFFLGAVQLFFIGFLGEYIMAINERVKKRPLVIEEKRINFDQ
ncbi:MAG: glycosyltransferase family 2 protein [Clostridia bacterium]|nr:glycosyltransferase family 2 protein [Clostridia bacterium]